jgi:predicted AlkP superfamily pyrophosphatase or phosphodiesterase
MKKINRWVIRLFLVFILIISTFLSTINRQAYTSVLGQKVSKNYLVVISVDALNAKDFDIIKDLPNFKMLLDNGSYAKEVVGIYPSLTYPSHTSIITGVYPDKHGIVNNKYNQIGVKKFEWYWYHKDIKTPTLYDLAKEKRLSVGALAWPVTAGAPIDYNYPEMWTINDGDSEEELIKRNGTSSFVSEIRSKFGKKLKERNQPELDNFIADSAAYVIKTKKPELLLVHLVELDSKRHGYGTDAPIIKEILEKQDERIGKIIKAARNAGIYENTTFIVLGDHGFIDVEKKINLNTALKKEGLITIDQNDNVVDWKAWVDNCDGSAYINLKDKNDEETKTKLEALLKRYKEDDAFGIEEIYTKEDIKRFRTNPEADFMVEAKEGFYISSDWQGEAVIEKSGAAGTHGFSPYKPNYNTFFMVSGAKAQKGVVLPKMNLVDEAPTMAKILDIEMKNVDGRVLKELVK